MSTQTKPALPLPEQKIRYALSMRIGAVLAVFFSTSWSLLQWALATEQFFMAEGVTRQFVQLEALACAIVAACAVLHVAANAIGWLVTAERMRKMSAGAARLVMKPTVRMS